MKSDIRDFVECYRLMRGPIVTEHSADEFIAEFSRMSKTYAERRKQSDEIQLREAPEYNIFHVLGVERDEVRTHSAFLCHLLSPYGSHGQGVFFLESFLCYCSTHLENFPSPPDFSDPKQWLVSSEEHTHFGRMDIVIQNPLGHFLCVIENKIDAPEGERQLARYGEWMAGIKREYPQQALCFLTIKGSISITAGNLNYFRLSYHEDIAHWLNGVLDKIEAPGVRAVVHQYQALAASL
jgi:hypothetical protein